MYLSLKQYNKTNTIDMTYENLDADTRGIIDSMCYNTGKTKEQAILALVEIGMVSMIASICLEKREKIMQGIYDTINKDEKLKKTAQVYSAYWDITI